ncbi:protease PrsW family protein [Leptospira ryugenii]|uniref:Protease PrsW family protein n=1 Tax=Leptospira ryugenii TaxID=1917863 RepID=A0A2P2DWX9_9LEPT|nr:PrsW family glutamic-type intramembrane protease [Leptospira ryugenii]GBF49133.1 protease PrsW family protein [Leptospira ryugenii]
MGEFISFSSFLIFGINLATVLFYYVFYRFHFYHYTETVLHSIAISFSVFSAGIALAMQASILSIYPYPNHFFKAFILSASVEEIAKLLGILIFFRKNQDDFSVTDGIFYGLVLGGVFGLFENILYFIDSGLWSQVLRSITSLPIHMINGGLIGGYLMVFLFSGNGLVRWIRLCLGLLICIGFHTFYNYALFLDIYPMFTLPTCLLGLFLILEFKIAKSRVILPGNVLKLMEMTVEEYQILSRHNRHEGWIQNVQKNINLKTIHLFQFPGSRHLLLAIFFFLPAIISVTVWIIEPHWINRIFPELEPKDYFALFIIYPFLLGFMVFFGGVINPYFFRDRMLAVPLFGSVDVRTGESEENTALYYIDWNKFFIPISKIYEPNTKAEFDLYVGVKMYSHITGKILWSKETEEGNCGAMCKLDQIPIRFLLHWNLVRFRQNLKNLFIRRSFY